MVLSPIQSFALPVSMQNSQQEIAVITDTSCFLFHPISQLSLVAARRFSIICRTMNSTKKSTTDQKGRLESFITSRRKFFYSHIVSEVSFWLALIVAFVSGGSIISRTTSEFYSAILSVSLTVGGILVFAFWTLRERKN